MKTPLDYTLDLERELNLRDGLDARAHDISYTDEGDAYVTAEGSRIIERHIKKIIEDVRDDVRYDTDEMHYGD